MNFEKVIMDLTSKTPSGGICWIGDVPFTVWYSSDYWEWEFQGVFYFDPQDLSEAVEAFMQQSAEESPRVAFSLKKTKAWPKQGERRRIAFPSKNGPSGLVSGPQK
jgi:hypothetical protein